MKDHTISIEGQKEMAENLNIKDIKEIDSDHVVMLSHPNQFADTINQIGKLYLKGSGQI